jgi:hypothetical protein
MSIPNSGECRDKAGVVGTVTAMKMLDCGITHPLYVLITAKLLPLLKRAEDTAIRAENKAETARQFAMRAEAVALQTAANVKVRKTLSASDQYLMRLTSLHGFQGYCHVKLLGCLGRIVDEDAELLCDEDGRPLGEYDHNFDVASADPRRSQLGCRNCNQLLKDHKLRRKTQHAFHEFQRMLDEVMDWKYPRLFRDP